MIEEAEAAIADAYGRLAAAVELLQHLHETYLDDLNLGHARQRQELDDQLASRRQQVGEAHQQRLGELAGEREAVGDSFATQIAEIVAAHPWTTAAFDDPVWATYQPSADQVGGEVRIGRLDLGADARAMLDIPALVPFLGDGHILIHASGDALAAARELLATAVLRLVTSTRPGSVRLALADPVGDGRQLSAFLRLPPATRVGAQVAVTGSELEALLGTLAEHVIDVTQTRLTNVYDTIEEYNAATTGVAVPYHVLVISDLPSGLTERGGERLAGLARNGPRAGVYIVALVDDDTELPRGFELADLGSTVHHLRYTGNSRLSWDDPDFADYPVIPDVTPSAARANAWLDAIGTAVAEVSDRLPFDRIAVPPSDHWTGDSTNGLDIQIGVDARGEPQRLTIGRGAVHHALIGGDTQMGKSNLLQVMITQLALRYPPDELEMHLLDFKQVEFHSYLTHGLPHARAIASYADREFGLSVLRRFRTEIDRRSELFQQADVEHLRDYRRVTGQRLPRSLVVMDEFQALFPEHDQLSTAAGFLLEDIAKRGAAFGMHLVMCSQAPTSGLVGTYLRPIYEQMGLRIALRCQSPNVSHAILGDGNDAATKLRRAGDAVYNDWAGAGNNPTVRIAKLPGPERREWLKTINALGAGREFDPPATFHPTSPAHLTENPACAALLAASDWSEAAGDTIHAWLGEPVEIKAATAATFERYPGSNLLVIADAQVGHALLLSSLLSIAVQRSPVDVSFVVAEFARPASPFHGFFAPLDGKLPHRVDVAGPRAAGGSLDRLIQTMTSRADRPAEPHPALFFLIAGMHGWRELAPHARYDRSDMAKRLAQLADEGPELGIHIVAWADSCTTVSSALQGGALNLFDQRVAIRVTSDTDSLALFGTPAAVKLPDNRALYRVADWEAGRVEKFKPYSLPAVDHFKRLNTRGTRSTPQLGATT